MARQEALFAQENPNIRIPQATRFDLSIGKTKVFQIYFEGFDGRCKEQIVREGHREWVREGHREWTEAVLPSGHAFRVVARGSTSPEVGPFLRDTGDGLRWEGVRLAKPDQNSRNEALASWRGAFTFREEDQDAELSGLRTPQIGALHAIHAHWTVSDEPAMIVMPTGTGKTETMLSTLVSQRCERVLVIVPSLILRDQVFGKFANLGLLKKLGVLSPTAQLPVVGQMRGSIETAEEVDQIFGACNVVVAVINSVAKCSEPQLQSAPSPPSSVLLSYAHTYSLMRRTTCRLQRGRGLRACSSTSESCSSRLRLIGTTASGWTGRSFMRSHSAKPKSKVTSSRFDTCQWWSSCRSDGGVPAGAIR